MKMVHLYRGSRAVRKQESNRLYVHYCRKKAVAPQIFPIHFILQIFLDNYFTNAINFKVLVQHENVTPVWKCTAIKLHSASCLKNLRNLCFVIGLLTKRLLHRPRHGFALFG